MEMRTICETCESILLDNSIAFICSYECTYCETCASEHQCVCPNCDGELVRRPRRVNKVDESSTQ